MGTKKISRKKNRSVKQSKSKRSLTKNQLKTLRKLKTKIQTKLRQYKNQQKRTKKVKRVKRKSKTQEKGGLKLLSKIKRFLREPTYMAPSPPSMSELGRYTIKGPEDVKLFERVANKIAEIEQYNDQPYCDHCNDADGGCVMCQQHN